MQISYEANTKHGWPTSEAERIQQALWLMDNGATAHSAAAALSVPKAALNKAASKRATDDRFRTLGISPVVIERLAESSKWRLSAASTDEGFVALTDLVDKAALSTEDVWRMVTEMNELKSSAKQVDYVATQREVYAEQISASGGGVFTRRARGPKASLAIAFGCLLNLPDDMDLIVKQYQGPEREDAAKRMRAAARRLNEIAKSLSA